MVVIRNARAAVSASAEYFNPHPRFKLLYVVLQVQRLEPRGSRVSAWVAVVNGIQNQANREHNAVVAV